MITLDRDGEDLKPDLVKEHLNRILGSPSFRRCTNLKRFLQYTVEKTLQGRAEEIKEYTLAVEAFDRKEDFDPLTDSIVRVQAGNLRKRLEDYYATVGVRDTLVIRYERGDYKPRFSKRELDCSEYKSIAVMPLSTNHSREYLGNGFSEELSGILATDPDLHVIGQNSAETMKAEAADVPTVAHALGVELLLHGTISNLKLHLALFDVKARRETWSKTYSLGSDLSIHDPSGAAMSVARDLALSPSIPSLISKHSVSSSKALDLHLRAKTLWATRKPQNVKKAEAFLKLAIEIDPLNAKIRATLAGIYCTIASYSVGLPRKYFMLAQQHAQESLRYDDRNAEAHAVLAVVAAVFEWNFDLAENGFKQALTLEPANALIYRWKAVFLMLPLRRFDEALACLFEARELEPVLDLVFTDLAGVYNALHRHDEALMYCEIAIENNRASFRGHWMKGLTLECRARTPEEYSEAASEFEIARRCTSNKRSSRLIRGSLVHAYSLAHETKKAEQELQRMKIEKVFTYVSAYDFAVAYAGMSDSTRALSYLDKALKERSVGLTFLAVDPRWHPYRDDPQFMAILDTRKLRTV